MDNEKIIQLNDNGRYSYLADGQWGKRQMFSNFAKLIDAIAGESHATIIVKFNRTSLGFSFVETGTRRINRIAKALGMKVVTILPDAGDSFSYTAKLVTTQPRP